MFVNVLLLVFVGVQKLCDCLFFFVVSGCCFDLCDIFVVILYKIVLWIDCGDGGAGGICCYIHLRWCFNAIYQWKWKVFKFYGSFGSSNSSSSKCLFIKPWTWMPLFCRMTKIKTISIKAVNCQHLSNNNTKIQQKKVRNESN